VAFAETAVALQELVHEGKIRHVGVSNFDAKQVDEFARWRAVETLQPPYHLFRREIEAELLPYAQEHDMGVLVYGPLAHGLLSGALREDTVFAPDDWRSQSDLCTERTAWARWRSNSGTKTSQRSIGSWPAGCLWPAPLQSRCKQLSHERPGVLPTRQRVAAWGAMHGSTPKEATS
jgi:aryl-alcohol dehydrogenase-like predicted oxidoreductase